MPEGPEVEVVRRGLLQIVEKEISDAWFADHPKYRILSKNQFVGNNVKNIARYGKFLVWKFEDGLTVVNHLGMTGIWRLFSADSFDWKSLRHPKIVFGFVNAEKLVFEDVRTFGKFEIVRELPSVIQQMGPDILKPNFDMNKFISNIRGKGKNPRRQQIGKLLLDQSIIAGCGNIYKSEALFLAKINPFCPADKISDEDLERLANALISVAKMALKSGGSTLRDFSSVEGYNGLMQNKFNVYGKEGSACIDCGNKIERVVQGGRSTFFCRVCQNL